MLLVVQLVFDRFKLSRLEDAGAEKHFVEHGVKYIRVQVDLEFALGLYYLCVREWLHIHVILDLNVRLVLVK